MRQTYHNVDVIRELFENQTNKTLHSSTKPWIGTFLKSKTQLGTKLFINR